jgi:O-antigen/teichoic acid export membrane protein
MQPLKIRSIKVNYVLNNIRLLLNVLIPLVIFPYVSRVLGPSGLGKVEFANSIVSYFVLFTTLGIPVYGVREIARRRDDSVERSKVVWELTLILIGTIFIGYAAYFILVRFIPSLYDDKILYFIIAPTVFLSAFNYEWFYTGIEDQLYITIRFIIIKTLQLILIFLCIKKSDDFIIYAGIIVGLNSFASLFNIIRLKKYVYFVSLSKLNIRRHIKAIFYIFSFTVASYIYMHLDVTMVGIMVGDTAVGLYTAANKIVRIIITVVISLPAIMVPRIENALKHGNIDDYKKYLNKSLQFILFFSIPFCFGIIILAPEIIYLFAGKMYAESIFSVRLLALIIIIVGLIEYVGYLILMPNRKEKHFAISVTVAAITNGVFNFFLIPIFQQNGAILGTVLAELIVLLLQIVFAWKLLKDTELFSRNTIKYFIAGIIMTCSLIYIHNIFKHVILTIIICFFSGSMIYIFLLFLLREKTIFTFLTKRH